MIIEQTTQECRKAFLLKFTRKLIEYSSTNRFFELENIVKEEENIKKEKEEKPLTHHAFKVKIKKKFDPFPKLKKIEQNEMPLIHAPAQSLQPSKQIIKIKPLPRVKIPEYQLPSTVQHLRPIPTGKRIDLGKLNPLIKDPRVRTIECNGADKAIIVKGSMGAKRSKIILTKEEIDLVIKTFSKQAKIPVHEGVVKIFIGNLMLSAIISEVIDSKFIIRKVSTSPRGPRRIYAR